MLQTLCRTMFCPKCNASKRPRKGDIFVIHGHTRKKLFVRTAHQEGIKGFTPHLICYEKPLCFVDNKIDIITSCAMHNCGVYVGEEREDQTYPIEFIDVHELQLTKQDFLALLLDWKNTGFELI